MAMITTNPSCFNPENDPKNPCLNTSRLPKAEYGTITVMGKGNIQRPKVEKLIHGILDKLNFCRLYDNYEAIKSRVDTKSYNSFLSDNSSENLLEPGFNQQTSKLKNDKNVKIKAFNGDIIAIDIGGTHTKVAILKEGQENKDAEFILDENNDFFKDENYPLSDETKESNINKFIGRVVEQLSKKLRELYPENDHILDNIKGLSVIWSNAVKSQEIKSDKIKGITGIVEGVKKFYQKGEWFTNDLEDGVDLGQIFIDKFSKYGMENLTTFCIGNDTVFTQLALNEADAGVVNSTGGNATAVGPDGEIYNLESGAGITIKQSELSEVDLEFFKECGYITSETEDFECPIQYLASGNWLDKMLNKYVVKISDVISQDFKDDNNPLKILVDNIRAYKKNNPNAKSQYIGNKMISSILKGEDPFYGMYDNVTLEYLTQICKEVVDRAAYAGAFILYSSIAHRITGDNYDKNGDEKLIIALDSSLARNMREYNKAFIHDYFLNQLVKNKNVEVVELKPIKITCGGTEYEISVPLQGAFNAIKRCQA